MCGGSNPSRLVLCPVLCGGHTCTRFCLEPKEVTQGTFRAPSLLEEERKLMETVTSERWAWGCFHFVSGGRL